MKKYVDGEYIEMTDEEIKALQSETIELEPTVEERLAALEALMAARGQT